MELALRRAILYGRLTGNLIMYSFQIHSLEKNKVIDTSHRQNTQSEE